MLQPYTVLLNINKRLAKIKDTNNTIREILNKNHINESFVKLNTPYSIINEIYATQNYILKIPTDDPEANDEAFTESVAAPLARSNGIKTPELICFDDSYTILDKTYSIWERIHGLPLGETDNYLNCHNTWKEIGFELGKLHVNVKNCHDPNGWLNPDTDYIMMIESLSNNAIKSTYLSKLIKNKYTENTFSYKKCFIHGDTNEFNFLCTENDQLLSIIDWGDSGWGDPAIDFYMIPTKVIDHALDGYSQKAGINIDLEFIYRIILYKIWTAIEDKQDVFMLENEIIDLENKLLKGKSIK